MMKVQDTRYPEAFPLPSIEGSNFTSTLLKQFNEMLCVKGITTSPNRPQSNGKCERYNGTLKKVLKKLCITYEKD
jgi:transposase InsO family protein